MRKCKVNKKGKFVDAYFHRWSEYANVVEPSPMIGGAPGGQIKYTLGIVEYTPSGVVEEVAPHAIIFMDNPEI